MSDPSKPKDEKEQEPRSPDLRFVALSKIKPLPGTYVKDEPRKDYSGLIADIKKNGLQKPIILRQSEKEGEFQLVDGFHRCKALRAGGDAGGPGRCVRNDLNSGKRIPQGAPG